jgi:hypothetical protein
VLAEVYLMRLALNFEWLRADDAVLEPRPASFRPVSFQSALEPALLEAVEL